MIEVTIEQVNRLHPTFKCVLAVEWVCKAPDAIEARGETRKEAIENFVLSNPKLFTIIETVTSIDYAI